MVPSVYVVAHDLNGARESVNEFPLIITGPLNPLSVTAYPN